MPGAVQGWEKAELAVWQNGHVQGGLSEGSVLGEEPDQKCFRKTSVKGLRVRGGMLGRKVAAGRRGPQVTHSAEMWRAVKPLMGMRPCSGPLGRAGLQAWRLEQRGESCILWGPTMTEQRVSLSWWPW